MSPTFVALGWFLNSVLQMGALLVLLGSLWAFARYLKDAR